MTTLSRELHTSDQSETPINSGQTLYDKFRKSKEATSRFYRSARYNPLLRQQEISAGIGWDLYHLAKPGIALIAGTALLIGIAHSISYDNPQIQNMRTTQQVDKNAWRNRYGPTPLEQIKTAGIPTPPPADQLPSRTSGSSQDPQPSLPSGYDPEWEGSFGEPSVPTVLPSPTADAQTRPPLRVDAGGNFGGEVNVPQD